MKIPKDKQLHFMGGAILSVVFSFLFSPVIGFAITAIIGIAKEVVRDWYLKMGTPEVMDAVATILGGAIGSALVFFIEKL